MSIRDFFLKLITKILTDPQRLNAAVYNMYCCFHTCILICTHSAHDKAFNRGTCVVLLLNSGQWAPVYPCWLSLCKNNELNPDWQSVFSRGERLSGLLLSHFLHGGPHFLWGVILMLTAQCSPYNVNLLHSSTLCDAWQLKNPSCFA